MITLTNKHLKFDLNESQFTWSLCSAGDSGLALKDVKMQVNYGIGLTRFTGLNRSAPYQVSGPEERASPHGPLRQFELSVGPESADLHFTLSFALPEEAPVFLWKMAVHNGGSKPVALDRLTLLKTAWRESPQTSLQSPAFFSNGWNSWTHSGVYGVEDRFRCTRLGPFSSPTRVNAGTPQPWERGHFASDMFGVLGDRVNRKALVAGFLSQNEHFGSLEARLREGKAYLSLWANGDRARLDAGQSMATDWACACYIDIDNPDPLAPYLEAVVRQCAVGEQRPVLGNPEDQIASGWCSWYQFFAKVTAEDIQRNLKFASGLRNELPLEVIQIDDGWEDVVGDWFEFKPGFPGGVAPLGEAIRAAGYTPGLWLAPFVVHPRSRLVKSHPDWLLRGRYGCPVNAGFLFNGVFTTALDLTHPGALDYAREVVHRAVKEWGFSYLKLDFLYAAALPGRYQDPTLTRAQVLRLGLETLREAAGRETFLVGCGCPLGSALGVVDAMRIGPDVDVRWKPAQLGTEFYFQTEPDLASTRNAIHNSLTRAFMHRRWWLNDPDCLLARSTTLLTLAEVQSLATVIAMSGGLVLLSDELPELTPERLEIARAILPPIGERPQVLDWFDAARPSRLRLDLKNACGAWHLLALFNWDDNPLDLTLRLEDFHLPFDGSAWGREFWSDETCWIGDGKLEIQAVPAHGVVLMAVRRVSPGTPQYLGSDFHISQGLEVETWDWQDGRLALRLRRPGRAQGQMDLYLPVSPNAARLDGRPLGWRDLGQGAYRFALDFEGSAEIRIE